MLPLAKMIKLCPHLFIYLFSSLNSRAAIQKARTRATEHVVVVVACTTWHSPKKGMVQGSACFTKKLFFPHHLIVCLLRSNIFYPFIFSLKVTMCGHTPSAMALVSPLDMIVVFWFLISPPKRLSTQSWPNTLKIHYKRASSLESYWMYIKKYFRPISKMHSKRARARDGRAQIAFMEHAASINQ